MGEGLCLPSPEQVFWGEEQTLWLPQGVFLPSSSQGTPMFFVVQKRRCDSFSAGFL